VTPTLAAADVAAPLTEWALNMPLSIPAFSSNDFSHLAKVEELTGLCGFTTARNKLVRSTSFCERSCFLLVYSQCLFWAQEWVLKSWKEEFCSRLPSPRLFGKAIFLECYPLRGNPPEPQV
jgi:hypothetical protein